VTVPSTNARRCSRPRATSTPSRASAGARAKLVRNCMILYSSPARARSPVSAYVHARRDAPRLASPRLAPSRRACQLGMRPRRRVRGRLHDDGLL
jgi:hypothetical protein